MLVRFGFPALVAAVPGALLLDHLSLLDPLTRYRMGENEYAITPVKLAAGLLLIVFASAELFPFIQRLVAVMLYTLGDCLR